MWGPRTVGPGPPRSSRYNLRSRAGHSMTGPCAAPCTVVEWRAGRGTEAKRRSRRVVSRRPASPARARHERHPSPSPRLRGAEPAPLPAVEGKVGAPPSTRGGRGPRACAAGMRERVTLRRALSRHVSTLSTASTHRVRTPLPQGRDRARPSRTPLSRVSWFSWRSPPSKLVQRRPGCSVAHDGDAALLRRTQ